MFSTCLGLGFLLGLLSCTVLPKGPETAEKILERATNQKVFQASYDQVWRATHTTLKYTIASENQDFGVIETDYVKAVDGYLAPYKSKPDLPGSRYKLIFNFAKGVSNSKESTRVTIEKKIEVFRNVISDVEIVPSDGTEERILFYRIERELVISEALRKAAAAEDSKQKPN